VADLGRRAAAVVARMPGAEVARSLVAVAGNLGEASVDVECRMGFERTVVDRSEVGRIGRKDTEVELGVALEEVERGIVVVELDCVGSRKGNDLVGCQKMCNDRW